MVAIVFVILFLLGLVYLFFPFVRMLQNLGTTGENLSKALNPSFFTFVVGSFVFLVVILSMVSPLAGNIFYQAYLDIMPQIQTATEVKEGFLMKPVADDPAIVITKQNLLERLHGHSQNLSLPYGLNCSNLTKLAVEGHLKRILLISNRKMEPLEFKDWLENVYTLFSYVCEEKRLIGKIIDKVETGSKVGFTFNDLRTLMEQLLHFYNTKRVNDDRYRSRDEVNHIFGIPLGERDPRNETVLKGTNSLFVKTSINDTGMNPYKISDYSDPLMFAKVSDTPDVLPTQTNELNLLYAVSDKSIPRVSANTRGGNQ